MKIEAMRSHRSASKWMHSHAFWDCNDPPICRVCARISIQSLTGDACCSKIESVGNMLATKHNIGCSFRFASLLLVHAIRWQSAKSKSHCFDSNVHSSSRFLPYTTTHRCDNRGYGMQNGTFSQEYESKTGNEIQEHTFGRIQ